MDSTALPAQEEVKKMKTEHSWRHRKIHYAKLGFYVSQRNTQ
jgi:hypothetical protein